MRDKNQSSGPVGKLDGVLVSARSLAEYRAMFSLTDEDLTKTILDCPGGAASFTGEANELGGDVTACDSAYFDATPTDLAEIAVNEAARGNDFVHTHRHDYAWIFFSDPGHHERVRNNAAARFAVEISDAPERYVPARLPSLPFGDNSFDLVLSSHLLFSYSGLLGHKFHLDSITELIRVSRGEVRIFPLLAVGEPTPYPRLGELLGDLAARGITGRIVKVDYEFQKDSDEMLVCSRPGPHP